MSGSELSRTGAPDPGRIYREIARLASAYPRQEMRPSQLNLYADELAGVPARLLAEAITGLIRSSEWFPTVAAIRRACAEIALKLPTEAEAVAVLDTPRGDQAAAQPHPLVTQALRRMGGLRAYRASQRPDQWRSDFARAYRELRAETIRQAQADDERLNQ